MSSKYKALNDASRLANGEEPKLMEDKLVEEISPGKAILELCKAITNIVEETPGIRAIDLIIKTFDENQYLAKKANIGKVLDALVMDGELVEVYYTVPRMNSREKTVYFPKGTKIRTK